MSQVGTIILHNIRKQTVLKAIKIAAQYTTTHTSKLTIQTDMLRNYGKTKTSK